MSTRPEPRARGGAGGAPPPPPPPLPLPREFYSRDTVTVARDLLGMILVHRIGGRTMSGVISETEAYGHADDPASHACRRMTRRNRIMFGPVGMSYVYFTYGMHYCFNATARDVRNADAGAVLIRGIMPREGIAAMMRNRGTTDTRILADGPAKLAQAMEISAEQYGEDLTAGAGLYITGNPEYEHGGGGGGGGRITASPRVGIREAADRLWNFKLDA